MPDLKGILDVALFEFNRIRTYVVEARVVEHFDGGFKVFFSGSFCQTCGYYDYFEDLLYLLLDDFGVETKITDVTQEEDGDYVSFHLI
jgi:superoxide reductase